MEREEGKSGVEGKGSERGRWERGSRGKECVGGKRGWGKEGVGGKRG